MSEPSKLILTVGRKNLAIPTSKALYAAWRIATYPLTLAAGYYFFGTDGMIFTILMLVLQNRGQL